MKRKRERKVLMDQMKDVETSSDEDAWDNWFKSNFGRVEQFFDLDGGAGKLGPLAGYFNSNRHTWACARSN